MTKQAKPSRRLEKAGCGDDLWQEVKGRLTGIEALDLSGDDVNVARSKLGREALGRVVGAITLFVDAGHSEAAFTLMHMCWVSVRLELLDLCPDRIRQALGRSDNAALIDKAMQPVARDALRHFNRQLPAFLKAWAYCLPETRESLSETVPLLSPKTIEGLLKELPDDLQGELLCMAVEQMPNAQGMPRLAALASLCNKVDAAVAMEPKIRIARLLIQHPWQWDILSAKACEPSRESIKQELVGGSGRPLAMAELALGLLDALPEHPLEVLRFVVDLASNTAPDRAYHLEQLAWLLPALDPVLSGNLASCIEHASKQLPDSERESALAILEKIKSDMRSGILGTKEGDGEASHVMEFEQSLKKGNLQLAASLFRHAPPGWRFREKAFPALYQAIVTRLEAAGFTASAMFASAEGHHAWNLVTLEKTEKQKDMEPAAVEAVAGEMATVLFMTGDPYCIDAAARLLLLAGVKLDFEHVLESVLEGSGNPGDNLVARMVHALPMLCSGDDDPRLDLILSIEGGQRLVANAVVDYLLQIDSSSGTDVASLFKALAHRIDLRPALPKATMSEKAIGIPNTLVKLATQMETVDFGTHPLDRIRDVAEWRPGWRLLRTMSASQSFSKDLSALLAAMAVDAAARDPKLGGTEERMDLLSPRTILLAVRTMLGIKAKGQPLLSGDALRDVMRAVVSSPRMTREIFQQIIDIPQSEGEALYQAMARAVVSFLEDQSPSRFDDSVPQSEFVRVACTLLAHANVESTAMAKQGFRKEDWDKIVKLAWSPHAIFG